MSIPRPLYQEVRNYIEDLISRPSSLTNEQVHQCTEELKAYYRESLRNVTVDPLNFMERVELDELYTDLSIIDRSSKRSKTTLTYDDLLANYGNGNHSKRLLIQGEGGVGKTTLCAKIAWDWCQGRILQDLDMVLLIPLRRFKNENSIGGIVKRYLSDANTAKTRQIDNYILTNQSRVFIIFDGFDEFQRKLSGKSRNCVIRILRIKQYRSCKVIVTTRPWRTDEFMMNRNLVDAYTFLSVEGFTRMSLSDYIRRFFRSREDNLAENLICFIEENDVIQSNMAPFPINCAMLCLMWNDFSEDRRREMQNLLTFSKFFGEMISFLKEHYASKLCENLQTPNIIAQLKKAGKAIQEISEIALKGLFDRNLSFPEEHFSECHDAMETCCRVGVLTIERDVFTRERRRDNNISTLVASTVSFPHKLFQECIAGVYIEYLFANDRANYVKVKNKLLSRPEEFRYVIYFISASVSKIGLDMINGLINCATNDFNHFSLEKDEDGKRDFCVDVAFECHTEEATIAVGERWDSYTLSFCSSEHTMSGVGFIMRFNNVIKDLLLYLRSLHNFPEQSSMDLAGWVCVMPYLSKFTLVCPYLLDSFLLAAAASAPSCQVECITINGKPLRELLRDSQGGTEVYI
ncbi:NLR family CARD domain-containing protein 4-like [Diadema setosum]|uniref:NLR family CARD domain-containing protein 4-like n=1 Tax=Diadema setosum TaxID=31175 RepID=UPI003B3A47D3